MNDTFVEIDKYRMDVIFISKTQNYLNEFVECLDLYISFLISTRQKFWITGIIGLCRQILEICVNSILKKFNRSMSKDLIKDLAFISTKYGDKVECTFELGALTCTGIFSQCWIDDVNHLKILSMCLKILVSVIDVTKELLIK
jgi:hypothetical protein